MLIFRLDNMNKRRGVLLAVVLGILIVFMTFVPAVDTGSVLLKISLHEGDKTEKLISLSSDVGGQFNLNIEGVKGVSLGETDFVLKKGEQKQVSVKFDSGGLKPGVYVGSVRVVNEKDISNIPIIFEVESKDIFFDINLDIPPQYTSVEPGGKFIAQLKVFDLTSGGTTPGLGATNVKMNYFFYSLDGKVLSSEDENVVVDQSTRITKTMSLPADVSPGDYVFVSSAGYKSSLGVASQIITVTKPQKSFLSGGSSSRGGLDLTLILIVGGIVGFIILIIFLFVYLIHDRDKLILELRKYNSIELRRQQQFLLAQQKLLTQTGRVSRKEIKKEVKKKIVKLKEKHKEREIVFKKLEKAGNKEEMQRRLNEWKREGYNTMLLESKVKGMKEGDMKSIMAKWKKQGYKF